MFCAKCSKELSIDSVFCPECGERAQSLESNTVSPGLNFGVIAGSFLIPLLGIIMGIIYIKDPIPAKRRAGKIWLWVGIGIFAFYFLITFCQGMMEA